MLGVNWSIDGAREACTWLNGLQAGLVHGWSQPTRALGSELGMASFARACRALGDDEANVLELRMLYLAQTMHTQLMTIITGRGDLYDPLTVEELAALKWAAQGKTAHETAQLMGVDSRRVIYLLQLARNKMRASTTIQAAVRAQGYGLF
jgi:DNA-binding CsgD family transcriptional regulator